MAKSPVELLETALKKEQSAYVFYERMTKESRMESVIELAQQLKNEEAKHVQMIQKMLTNIRLGKNIK